MIANTRAKASEQNTNFGVWRGHIIPIDPTLAAAANNAYDLGSSEYKWRNAYLGGTASLDNYPQVSGIPIGKLHVVETVGACTLSPMVGLALGNTTNTAFNFTLPHTTTGMTGASMKIKKTNTGTNLLGLAAATTTALIDGTSVMYVPRQYNWIEVGFGPSSWHVIGMGGKNETSSSCINSGNYTVTSDVTGLAAVIPTAGRRVEVFLAGTAGSSYISMLPDTATSDVNVTFNLKNNATTVASIPWNGAKDAAFDGVLIPSNLIKFSVEPVAGLQSFQLAIGVTGVVRFFDCRLIAVEVDG